MSFNLYTPEVLQVWRNRWKTDTYIGKARIVKNATDFLANPAAEMWRVGDINLRFPVLRTTETYTLEERKKWEAYWQGVKLKDAAFFALMNNDSKLANLVKKVLIDQANEPLSDFSIRARFIIENVSDQDPYFFVAEYLARLTVSYLFIKDFLTPFEQTVILDWFRKASTFFKELEDLTFNSIFPNRYQGDYSIVKNTNVLSLSNGLVYDGADKYQSIANYYNNRRLSLARTIALHGLMLEDDSLINAAALFYKEWVRFGILKDLSLAEMSRAETGFPDKGLSYASVSISLAGDIAYFFSLAGRNELYDYTFEGKNLLGAIKRFISYQDGSYIKTIYGKVINGVDLTRKWILVNEVNFLKYNLYFKDRYVEKWINKDYPITNAANNGDHQPFSGVWELLPDLQFMYKGLNEAIASLPRTYTQEEIATIEVNAKKAGVDEGIKLGRKMGYDETRIKIKQFADTI